MNKYKEFLRYAFLFLLYIAPFFVIYYVMFRNVPDVHAPAAGTSVEIEGVGFILVFISAFWFVIVTVFLVDLILGTSKKKTN